MNLRPYQRQACNSVFTEWYRKGRKRTLLTLPTGTGKTVVFSKLAEYEVRTKGHKVLILAHRNVLLEQASDKLSSITGLESFLEKGPNKCMKNDAPVVVASIQTMNKRRLENISPDRFDTIIIDEAHHVMSPGYRNLLEHFPDCQVLGVTATPDRMDEQSLMEVFESLAFEYSIKEAIEDGYLAKLKVRHIPISISLAGVKKQAGDYSERDLGIALDPYLHEIAKNMAKTCKGRKTVVFLPLIATSQKFAALLENYGFSALEINGNTDNKDEIYKAFKSGECDVLCNSMLLTEGWDCPEVDCVVVLRPTMSRALYVQMVGRGLRLADGKDNCLLLDFMWMTAKHDLCSPGDLLSTDPKLIKEMNERIREENEEEQDLDQIEQESKNVLQERENALRRAIEGGQCTADDFNFSDPHEVEPYKTILEAYSHIEKWEMDRPTYKQKETLRKHKLNPMTVTKGEACQIINEICSMTSKQKNFLRRHGFSDDDFDGTDKMMAGKIIGMIKSGATDKDARLKLALIKYAKESEGYGGKRLSENSGLY